MSTKASVTFQPNASTPAGVEQMTLAAMRASMDGIALLDHDGIYLYMNKAHAAIYGYESPEELVGEKWSILYGGEELKRFQDKIMPRFMQDGYWRGEAVGTRKDGSTFPQEISLNWMEGRQAFVCVCRDTTERVIAEQARTLYASVTSAALQATGLASLYDACMRSVCETLGFDRAQTWVPRDKTGELEYIQAYQSKGALHALGRTPSVTLSVRSSGRLFATFEFFSGSERLPTPSMVAVLEKLAKLLSPVFEREAYRQELERSTSLLRATINSSAEGLLVHDLDGNLILHNERFKELFGVTEEQLTGTTVQALAKEITGLVMTPGELLRRLEELLRHPVMESHEHIAFQDGRCLERHAIPQRLGERIIGRVLTFRDVSGAKRAEQERVKSLKVEQELRSMAEDSERRIKFIAEASALLDSSLDYEGTIRTAARIPVPRLADWCAIDILEGDACFRRMAVAAHDSAKEELRREAERLYSQLTDPPRGSFKVMKTGLVEFLDSVSPQQLPALCASEALLRFVRRMGARSYLCLPLKARGRTLGAITLAWSESDNRYSPRDFRLALELGHRASMAIDNARLYRESQEAVQSRHEFLSVASHEMRTPLTSLLGYLQLSRRAASADEISAMLANAEQQCLRLVRFLNDLLDVSRISARGIKPEYERMELSALVRETCEKVSHAYDMTGRQISIHAPETVWGEWDRLRLEQVVTNLLTNAIKYGAESDIEIRVERDDRRALFVVTDHGIGISQEGLSRIFHRFERAVSNRSYKGAGLGLWITRSIVEAHGGNIGVTSKAGEGSTFKVELPLQPPATDERS